MTVRVEFEEEEVEYVMVALEFQLDHDEGDSNPSREAGEEALRKVQRGLHVTQTDAWPPQGWWTGGK